MNYPGLPPDLVRSQPMSKVFKYTAAIVVMAVLFVVVTVFGTDTPPVTAQGTAPSAAAPAAAPDPVPIPPPVEEVLTLIRQHQVAPIPAPDPISAEVTAAPAPAAAPATATPPETRATTEQLEAELCALRDDMRMLQSTLDLMVNKIMADLREENEQLREEVRRLNALRGVQGMSDINAVPRPGRSAIDQALSEPPAAPPAPPPPPFKFTIVREWGRSAEEAQKLGGDTQSLKGLIGVVPAGSLRADVEKLARDLRNKYDGYDNINVEVFDDPVTAQAFAANRTADPEHRVLSVSRHKASNRDAIVILTNGKGEMISADPDAPPPSKQPDDLPTLSVTNPVSPGQAKRPKATDSAAPVDAAAPAAPESKAAEAQQEQSKPGAWQKAEKKVHVKGSSKKRKGASKEEPVKPENQHQIPEGPPLLVPHGPEQPQIPAQPETTVIVAPPGEPVTPESAAATVENAAPEKEKDAADASGAAEQENSDSATHNPKSVFGPKSKKSK